jgi:glycosyltransferase involved in cell wall biosynthesis
MDVLFLPKYGRKAASVRYRFLQYEPFLERAGIGCTVSPLLDDAYLSHKFQSGRTALGGTIGAFLRRTLAILQAGRFKLVVIHCEAFPYMPAWFEAFLRWRGIPYVYDYDDAIFHNYDQSQHRLVRHLLKGKIASVIGGARLVLAGSEYLAEYARRFNKHVENLPTVIDLERYPVDKKAHTHGRPFTVGWIGSPSTAQYLHAIAPALRAFCAEYPARVVLVGAGNIELAGVPVESRTWSEATEVDDLMQFDVGIMPLTDTPWARGKCAFKLIQYMACACPVVASPVGMNTEVVETGNGLLASNQSEWLQALIQLYRAPALRERLGQGGRAKVESRYCLQVTAPRLVALLNSAVVAARSTRSARIGR